MQKFKEKSHGKDFGREFAKAAFVPTSVRMNPAAQPDPNHISNGDRGELVSQVHRSTIQANVHVDKDNLDKRFIDQVGVTVFLSVEDYEAIQDILLKYI